VWGQRRRGWLRCSGARRWALFFTATPRLCCAPGRSYGLRTAAAVQAALPLSSTAQHLTAHSTTHSCAGRQLRCRTRQLLDCGVRRMRKSGVGFHGVLVGPHLQHALPSRWLRAMPPCAERRPSCGSRPSGALRLLRVSMQAEFLPHRVCFTVSSQTNDPAALTPPRPHCFCSPSRRSIAQHRVSARGADSPTRALAADLLPLIRLIN